MGIWRAFGPRPADVTRTELYYGGPCYIAGYCPTGEDSLYAYLVEEAAGPLHAHARGAARASMRELSQAYHGPWDEIRDDARRPGARVNYTWFETHVLPAPWNRGRVVLIGDAAHSCPPTLAQGAAQALEDAAVLAELLLARDRARPGRCGTRSPTAASTRASAVVEASVQLGQWLLDHERGDVPGLMGRIAALVASPPEPRVPEDHRQ